jgi:hypothetical protein
MRLANESLNATPQIKDGVHRSPISLFSGVDIDPNPMYCHHFGCPVYVLARPLQTAGGMFHKWQPRAKVGVYLGRSPQHARSVALVLSLETGLVSPQFHVSFDSFFQTVISTASEPNVPSHWQALAGLQEETSPTVELPSPEPSDGTSLPYIDAPLPSKAGSVDFLHLENDSPHEMGVPTVHTEPPVDSTPALPSVETASSAAPSPVRPIHPSPVRPNMRPQRERRPVQRIAKSSLKSCRANKC